MYGQRESAIMLVGVAFFTVIKELYISHTSSKLMIFIVIKRQQQVVHGVMGVGVVITMWLCPISCQMLKINH